MSAHVGAIVPAAGAGIRFGNRARKLFVRVDGAPLLLHALRALEECPSVRWVVPVVRPEERAEVEALGRRHRLAKVLRPCLGGATRGESVARGLAALPQGARWVLVHDGARPCVSRLLIQRTVREARRRGAVACGVPADVTVKAADARGEVRLTLDREQLWFVQTPQVFRRDWLTEALARGAGQLGEFPDDAAVLEAAGFPVRMVPGDPLNLKVTTGDDLVLAEAILRRRPTP